MTDQDLSELLERSANQTYVGPPPLEEMVARARRARRRRTVFVTAAASAAVVAVVAGAAVIFGRGLSQQQAEPAGASVSPSRLLGNTSSPDHSKQNATTSLNGTWEVRALIGRNGQSVLTPAFAHKVTVTFHDGQLTGTTGCNDVFGTYKQSGEAGQDLVFPRSQLGATLVGCRGEPPLVERLLAIRHVSGSGDVRRLHAANWMIVAELRRR